MTEKPSKEWSNSQKECSLISKYRKLQIKNKILENLWIGSTNKSFQLSKPSSTTINHVSKFVIYGMHCIVHSIQLNFILLMKKSLMNYCLFLYLSGIGFLRKNSSSLSLSATILLHLDLINFLRVISSIFSETRHVCVT